MWVHVRGQPGGEGGGDEPHHQREAQRDLLHTEEAGGQVIVFDGYSEIGAHGKGNLGFLICLRNLIRSIAVTNRIFFLQKDLYSCVSFELPSKYHEFSPLCPAKILCMPQSLSATVKYVNIRV